MKARRIKHVKNTRNAAELAYRAQIAKKYSKEIADIVERVTVRILTGIYAPYFRTAEECSEAIKNTIAAVDDCKAAIAKAKEASTEARHAG